MLNNVMTWKCVLQIQVWSGLCQLSRKARRIDKVYHALAKSRLSEKAEEANSPTKTDCLDLLVRQDILLSPDRTFLTEIDCQDQERKRRVLKETTSVS